MRRHVQHHWRMGKSYSMQAEFRSFQLTHRDSDISIIKYVQEIIRRPKYISDNELYGVDDYWATPEEFFEYGGDCEDAAIAAYFLLKDIGWPIHDLWLVISDSLIDHRTHAYLAVKANEYWYAIDQAQERVTFLISQRQIYRTLYIINEMKIVAAGIDESEPNSTVVPIHKNAPVAIRQ